MIDDPCADLPPGTCEDARRELYQYLDGYLTIERRTVIRTHLEACAHCGSTFEFEFELRQVVSRRCSDRVPDALRARVFDAIQRARFEG